MVASIEELKEKKQQLGKYKLVHIIDSIRIL